MKLLKQEFIKAHIDDLKRRIKSIDDRIKKLKETRNVLEIRLKDKLKER